MTDPKLDAVFGNVMSGIDAVSKWREPKTPPPIQRPWDRNPVLMKRKGVVGEYFTIGALAEALGRKQVTIRSWEEKRVIPKAPYREPPPAKAKLPDKANKGRRLYTREHIDAVVAAAKASGVYDSSYALNTDWAEFTRLVRLAWSTL